MEEWKDICGYEGIYQVSSEGNIRRVSHTSKYQNGKPPRILRQHLLANKYRVISLYKNGQKKVAYVHHLVAQAFLQSSPCCPTCQVPFEINHKDQNGCNNKSENLEYVTHAQNIRKAKEKHQKSCQKKLNEQTVVEIKRMISEGLPYSTIGKQFKISITTVCDIAKGRMWNHIPMPAIKKKHLKLVPEDVVKIKGMIAEKIAYRIIGEQFGVATTTISSIANEENWSHITTPTIPSTI